MSNTGNRTTDAGAPAPVTVPAPQPKARPAECEPREAASIAAESAEGIAGYSGLNGDKESARARAFIKRRVREMATRQAPKPAQS